MEELSFYDYQDTQIKKIIEILNWSYYGLDISIMGSGKTYVGAGVSLYGGFKHVIVVCPVSIEGKWENMKTYGVPIHQVLSYQTLRSTKTEVNTKLKNGLLSRFEDTFTVSEEFKELVKDGTLLIFDEIQNIKNKSAQYKASKTLISYIMSQETTSRILFASGTPFDKIENVINFLQLVGIIKSRNLYTKTIYGDTIFQGVQELIDFCNKFNKSETDRIIRSREFLESGIQDKCFILFRDVVLPVFSSEMSPQKNRADMVDAKNGFYNMDEVSKKVLEEGIRKLNKNVRYNSKNNTVDVKRGSYGSISKALLQIENSKVELFFRLAKTTLLKHPFSKVVLFMNYLDNIAVLGERLAEFNPLIITGGVSKKHRGELIKLFQEDNLEFRLAIFNTKVGSTGIDLDDKFGFFPRYAFVSPNYSVLDLHQLIGRFMRSDTKSESVIRFVYGKAGIMENSILNALSRKSFILKSTLKKQTESGIKFPGDFEVDVEN